MTTSSNREPAESPQRLHGRLIYSRGPIVAALALISAISAVLATIGLVFALLAYDARLNDIQAARQRSAQDSCRLFRGLVLTATPAAKHRAATVYIAKTPLRDCHRYSVNVTKTDP